jgi:hypothetical protein
MSQQGTSPSPSVPLDPLRWPLLFTLLSMDVVVAFYDLIGVPASDPRGLRDLLRAQILNTRRAFAAAPPGGAAYSPEETLDAVGQSFGAAERDHLALWGQRVFAWDIQEHRALNLWDHVLRHCASEPERWAALGLPARIAAAARRELLQALDRAPYDERHGEVFSKPLSDWDLHMYAVNLFDDEDPAIPTGPSIYLYATSANYRGYRFWAWLTKQLTAEEQGALTRNATQLAAQVESLSHVEDLPPPSHLEIGL